MRNRVCFQVTAPLLPYSHWFYFSREIRQDLKLPTVCSLSRSVYLGIWNSQGTDYNQPRPFEFEIMAYWCLLMACYHIYSNVTYVESKQYNFGQPTLIDSVIYFIMISSLGLNPIGSDSQNLSLKVVTAVRSELLIHTLRLSLLKRTFKSQLW